MIILLGADTNPCGMNKFFFREGSRRKLLNDLIPLIEESDAFILNLEGSFTTDVENRIDKSGPHLGIDPESIVGYRIFHPNLLLNLANNHSFDYGIDGFKLTRNLCNENNIATFGAGLDLEEAMKPIILQKDGLRVAVLGMAERESLIATDNSPGVNPIDIIGFVRFMRKNRDNFDHLIVLYHGGMENYSFPTPNQQKVCRFLIEQGVSIVVCQHSHIVGCYEYYENGIIIYGQGNFIFDYVHNRPINQFGLLLKIDLSSNNRFTVNWFPFSQSGNKSGVQMLDEDNSFDILSKWEKNSKCVVDPHCVAERWNEICKTKSGFLRYLICGNSPRLLVSLCSKLQLTSKLMTSKRYLLYNNILNCETHIELLRGIVVEGLKCD
ncbi:CapA family protein [Acidobacteriota bacterium]